MDGKQLDGKENPAAAGGQENSKEDNLNQENPAGTPLKSSSISNQQNTVGGVGGGGGALPCVLTGIKHRLRDLKSISGDTLARLMQGEFRGPGTVYQIIDCRYPYEFEGGHILGARNLYSRDRIREAFFMPYFKPKEEGQKRCIFVFHCEFSLERAPMLLRFLRSKDVRLKYPELYLLHDGYSKFYGLHPDLCEPNGGYVSMRAPAHRDDLEFFSWVVRCTDSGWH